MIMKKTLAILGAGIVVGAIAYAVWHKMNKACQTAENDFQNKKDNTDSEAFTPVVVNNVATEDDIDAIKSTVAQNMAARHEEAAQIMKDAVDIICKRRTDCSGVQRIFLVGTGGYAGAGSECGLECAMV